MIQINDARCTRCGLCAEVCPVPCFFLTEKGVRIRHQEYCMHCGHCAVACPPGAVILDGTSPDALPLSGGFPDEQSLTALMRGRRSVREFKEDAVPHDILLRALDTVRYAPTGKNLENIRWLVLEGRPTLHRVADRVVDVFRTEKSMAGLVHSHDSGQDPIFRGAPCVVFACAPGGYDLNIVNCSIAVAFLDLLLPAMGLGGCWAGFAMRAASLDARVREAMGIEEDVMPLAGLMAGFPSVRYRRIPQRRALRVRWEKGEQA